MWRERGARFGAKRLPRRPYQEPGDWIGRRAACRRRVDPGPTRSGRSQARIERRRPGNIIDRCPLPTLGDVQRTRAPDVSGRGFAGGVIPWGPTAGSPACRHSRPASMAHAAGGVHHRAHLRRQRHAERKHVIGVTVDRCVDLGPLRGEGVVALMARHPADPSVGHVLKEPLQRQLAAEAPFPGLLVDAEPYRSKLHARTLGPDAGNLTRVVAPGFSTQ